MGQQELHSQDVGREGDRDTSQPVADPPAAGISEALARSSPAPWENHAAGTSQFSSGSEQAVPLPGYEPRFEPSPAARYDAAAPVAVPLALDAEDRC